MDNTVNAKQPKPDQSEKSQALVDVSLRVGTVLVRGQWDAQRLCVSNKHTSSTYTPYSKSKKLPLQYKYV